MPTRLFVGGLVVGGLVVGGLGGTAQAAPFRIELAQEQGTPFGLRLLPDGGRRGPQGIQGAQEAPVGIVGPADVARAPPPGAEQGVQAAVAAKLRGAMPGSGT